MINKISYIPNTININKTPAKTAQNSATNGVIEQKSARLVDAGCNAAFLGSQKQRINKLEDNLANLGVCAYLGDKNDYNNFALAKSIHDSIVDLNNKGYKIPPGMYVSCNEWEDIFDDDLVAAATMVDHDKEEMPEMYFYTPLYFHEKGLPYAVRDVKDHKNQNAKLDMYHEFAHYWQAVNDRDNYFELEHSNFDDETKDEIKKHLTVYATANKAEFVAEYFAYKTAGKDIQSPKLEKLFNECKGPVPENELTQ